MRSVKCFLLFMVFAASWLQVTPTVVLSSVNTTRFYEERTEHHVYRLYFEKVTWVDAFENCEGEKSLLISVDTPTKLLYFNGLFNRSGIELEDQRIWTSGTDIFSHIPGNHHWLPNGRHIPIEIWGPGEPNNRSGDEHCLELWWRKDWDMFYINDKVCDARSSYVCKVRIHNHHNKPTQIQPVTEEEVLTTETPIIEVIVEPVLVVQNNTIEVQNATVVDTVKSS